MFVSLALISVTASAQHTYYIAANGSDSNTSTQARSKSTPWLHAPGMTGCTSNCASYTPVAGDQFIFRGGDVWHYSSAAGTPVGIPWRWSWGGSASSPIYIGVDQTWFAGNSWVRPLLNGDNPITRTPVSSCTNDESSTSFVSIGSANVVFDNFEFSGGCWHGTQNGYGGPCCLSYIAKGAPANPVNIVIQNVYMHGWSHVTFSCGSGGASGNCDGAQGITGDSHSDGGQGNQVIGVVIDGSDSDPTSLMAIAWDCYDVHNSIIRYNSNGLVCNNMHTFHDNLIEYISESSDGQTHSNGFEFNSEWRGTNTVYNNVVRHSTAAVTGWVNPSQVDYQFNNLVYDTLGQDWDVDATGGGTAMYLYNNTFVGGGVGSSAAWEGILSNNLFINGGVTGSPRSNSNAINWTTAQATAAGFTSGGNYAYAPTSANCNGNSPCPKGSGANLSTTCSTVNQLCSDTSYACSYNTASHSVSCPARTTVSRPTAGSWDIAAYQFGTSDPPAPPTNLFATPQ
jgi:hypothetical protein